MQLKFLIAISKELCYLHLHQCSTGGRRIEECGLHPIVEIQKEKGPFYTLFRLGRNDETKFFNLPKCI